MKTKEGVCKKIVLCIFSLLVLCRTAAAQTSAKATLSASDAGTCTVTSTACLILDIPPGGMGGATFSVSSNASANTVQFEGSADYGVSWVALNATPSNSTTAATSTTSIGTWQANVAAYTKVRMRISTLVAGTTATYINLSTASARSNGGGGSVTHTAGNLTAFHLMLGNGLADSTVDSACLTNGTGALSGCTSISAGSGASAAGATATGGFACVEAASTGWTPTAGQDYIRCDSSGRIVGSMNGGAEVPIGGFTQTSVTYSATPVFTYVSGSAETVFAMQLTGNVTSSTMAGTFVSGSDAQFIICQDGVGGRTFAWPASFLNTPTLASGASACTAGTWVYCGSAGIGAACPANSWQNSDQGPAGTGTGTVTHTAGNLTSNAVMLGNGTADSKVSTGITTDGATELDLGVSAGTPGILGMLGATAEAFNLTGRVGVTIPVPYLTPRPNNSAIAFDLYPHGSPSDFNSTTGVAWYDLCSTDINADGTNYECVRLGKYSTGTNSSAAQLSTVRGGTGVARNLFMQMNGGSVNVGFNTNSGLGQVFAISDAANAGIGPAYQIDHNSTPEAYYGLVNGSAQYFSDSVSNDLAIRGIDGATIRMGTNTTTPVTTFSVTSGSPGTVVAAGSTSAKSYLTATNCAGVGTAANPSVVTCTSAAAGAFSCATNASTGTCQVNTTAVTANSEIQVWQVVDEGTRLSVTCNTASVLPATPLLLSKSPGASFTITLGVVTTNPGCFDYVVTN